MDGDSIKLRDGAGVGERGGVPREGKESREERMAHDQH